MWWGWRCMQVDPMYTLSIYVNLELRMSYDVEGTTMTRCFQVVGESG